MVFRRPGEPWSLCALLLREPRTRRSWAEEGLFSPLTDGSWRGGVGGGGLASRWRRRFPHRPRISRDAPEGVLLPERLG